MLKDIVFVVLAVARKAIALHFTDLIVSMEKINVL